MKNTLLQNIHNLIINTLEPDGWKMHDEPTSDQRIYDCDDFEIACGLMSAITSAIYDYYNGAEGEVRLVLSEEKIQIVIEGLDE